MLISQTLTPRLKVSATCLRVQNAQPVYPLRVTNAPGGLSQHSQAALVTCSDAQDSSLLCPLDSEQDVGGPVVSSKTRRLLSFLCVGLPPTCSPLATIRPCVFRGV